MSTAATAPAKPATDEKAKPPRDPAREVVETVVFVVVLVLLLKLFVTEAFVIPTGSMAETLYGYQKVITCPKCGHEFPVNSHDEVEANTETKQRHKLVGYCCPNCRYQGKVDDLDPVPDNSSGDRVLVLKPLYHIRSPHRGDVVVFKYPEDPQQGHTAQNYIKRAMGFGGETIAVHRGELYVTTSLTYPEDELDAEGKPLYPRPTNPLDLWRGKNSKADYRYVNNPKAEKLFAASRAAEFTKEVSGGFQIIRKGEDQVLADRRVVWDNDKLPADLGPSANRWVRDKPASWNPDNERQPKAFGHSGADLDWIRYQHLTWKPVKSRDDEPKPKENARPKLTPWRWTDRDKTPPVAGPIDNVLGYNAGIDWNPEAKREQSRDSADGPQQLWVGDLILECEAEIKPGGEVALELSKGADRFRATFGGGKVTLSRSGARQAELGSRPCKVTDGTYQLRFANVDARLWVWVNGRHIDFGTDGDYNPAEVKEFDPNDTLKEGWTYENDIAAPANIGAKGVVPGVRKIRLHRDVYYTRNSASDNTTADIYYVQPGHYLCLGDNSAQSSDSRAWGTVPERLMLGKAVFVFYPVSLDWKLGWPPVRFNAGKNRVGFIK